MDWNFPVNSLKWPKKTVFFYIPPICMMVFGCEKLPKAVKSISVYNNMKDSKLGPPDKDWCIYQNGVRFLLV